MEQDELLDQSITIRRYYKSIRDSEPETEDQTLYLTARNYSDTHKEIAARAEHDLSHGISPADSLEVIYALAKFLLGSYPDEYEKIK